jgi:hypothetical protein
VVFEAESYRLVLDDGERVCLATEAVKEALWLLSMLAQLSLCPFSIRKRFQKVMVANLLQ